VIWIGPTDVSQGLHQNLKEYAVCKSPFIGGVANTELWWESLSITVAEYPIKPLALTLFVMSPYAADVERLFSGLVVSSQSNSTANISKFSASENAPKTLENMCNNASIF